MAKYSNGINGAFTGKVGNVVGTTWKGIPVLRAAPLKRSSKAKGNEKQNQTKFSQAHHFLQPMLTIVREGFKGYTERVEGFNAAKSYLLNNAFEGEESNMKINPALVRVSFGDLPLPSGITAGLAAEQPGKIDVSIEFSWDTDTLSNGASRRDQVMVAAYNVQEGRAYTNIFGEFRSSGSHILNVRKGHTYLLYLAFSANDRSRQSDSVYLGEITV